MSPPLRCLTRGQDTARPLQIILTAALSGLSLLLTYPLSITAAYLYAFCFIFVTFVAPGMLVWAQRYKKYVIYAFHDEHVLED